MKDKKKFIVIGLSDSAMNLSMATAAAQMIPPPFTIIKPDEYANTYEDMVKRKLVETQADITKIFDEMKWIDNPALPKNRAERRKAERKFNKKRK